MKYGSIRAVSGKNMHFLLVAALMGGVVTSAGMPCSIRLEQNASRATSLHPHRAESVWLDVDKKALPFQEEEELLEFLRTARAKKWEKVGTGVNQISKVLLEKEGIHLHGAWRVVEQEFTNFRLKDGTVIAKVRDSCLFEVAAYRLSRMLGMINIPPAVQRRLRGESGTLQLWLEDTVTQKDLGTKKGSSPRAIVWAYQNSVMRLFDSLICNLDRNQGNLLIDKDWKLWLIDHSLAFPRSWECRKLESLRLFDREIFLRLKALDKAAVRSEMRGLLNPGEIGDLFVRRDKIVSYIEGLISERGEKTVLF
jgi:hypothetical protein